MPRKKREWKAKRQHYNDKFVADLKKGGLSPTQAAYRSGYLKAAEHDAEAFKYGAARFRGANPKEARQISQQKRPAEIRGVKVKRTYVDEE